VEHAGQTRLYCKLQLQLVHNRLKSQRQLAQSCIEVDRMNNKVLAVSVEKCKLVMLVGMKAKKSLNSPSSAIYV